MAGNDVSKWWEVGEAPTPKEWCEQNVSEACDELSKSTTVSVLMPDPANRNDPPALAMWSTLWDDYVGENGAQGTAMATILNDLVDMAEVDAEYALYWLDAVAAQVTEARVKVAKIMGGVA